MAFAKWYRKRKVRGKRDHGGDLTAKLDVSSVDS